MLSLSYDGYAKTWRQDSVDRSTKPIDLWAEKSVNILHREIRPIIIIALILGYD
jgi:hypothetical protein